MFLAKYNNKMVIGNNEGYYHIKFDWNTFYWPESLIKNKFNKKNFRELLSECPAYEKAKIICVGRNYINHAKELGNVIPEEPLLFWKPNTALLSPHDSIILPKKSNKVQYETELVAVIGKQCKNISKDHALDYVLGYTIGLDITARDLQKKDKTWFRGKSFDTFAPVGPVIVPKESINLEHCKISLLVNNELRQQGNTKDMIFDLPTIISYISNIVTMEPGDLIFTGTPEGVGNLSNGDKLCATIEGIGTLKVSVKNAS
jgi:2-keto-4-pentenoate hydratase/2-oxohepta-3-ene-1,7-dioic acid hydratase in catechol pathway